MGLHATTISDRMAGAEWLAGESRHPVCPSGRRYLRPSPTWRTGVDAIHPGGAQVLKACLTFPSATGEGGEGYPWSILVYANGRPGMTAALQGVQHVLRQYQPGLDGVAISNTWGDRHRDACMGESFMLRELALAAELGIDACQLDDGWQKGVTSNSSLAKEKGGVWEGFHAADSGFWQVHPQRFPNGLQPLLARAREKKLGLGLWFAPDSADDFAQIAKDAETLCESHFFRLRMARSARHGQHLIVGGSFVVVVSEAVVVIVVGAPANCSLSPLLHCPSYSGSVPVSPLIVYDYDNDNGLDSGVLLARSVMSSGNP